MWGNSRAARDSTSKPKPWLIGLHLSTATRLREIPPPSFAFELSQAQFDKFQIPYDLGGGALSTPPTHPTYPPNL